MLLAALPRCNCDDGLTRIEEPPPPPPSLADAETFTLDSGVHEDAMIVEVIDAGEPDSGELDAMEPVEDSGVTIEDLCDTLTRQSRQQSFTFPNVGPCPWGQGDNLPIEGAMGWSARTEQIENVTDIPSNAIICAASFSIPQTAMWFDDAMVISMQGVVLMTDANVGVLPTDGMFFLYDWLSIRGNGGSALYCLGESTGEGACTLPAMETPGPMSLSISAGLAQQIGERAMAQGSYEIRVVTMGDNDANDCVHEPFDFVVTLDYVVP